MRRAWSWCVLAVLAAPPASAQAAGGAVATMQDDYAQHTSAHDTAAHDTAAHDTSTRAMLERIPGRDALLGKAAALDALASRVAMLASAGGRRFYLERAAAARTASLHMREANGARTVLVDADVSQFTPSPDGSLVGYGLSRERVLRVIATATRETLADVIDGVDRAQVSWLPDNHGFFYTKGARLFRHTLGAGAGRDRLALDPERPPFAFPSGRVSTISVLCGTDLAVALLGGGPGPELALYTAPLASMGDARIPWRPLAAPSDEVVGAAVRGGRIDLLTRKDAPNFKIVETVSATPDFASARVLVPEGSGVLTGLALASDGLYVARSSGAAATLLRLADRAALPEIVALPFPGAISPPREGRSGLIADPMRPGVDIVMESWLQPLAWLHYDPRTHQVADLGIVPAFGRSLRAYQAIETTATARDGMPVALTVMSRRDAPHDHQRPTLLVADAGAPRFNPLVLPWLDDGGLYAVAHVGSDAALFIDSARALLDRRVTDRAHLAGGGPAPILEAIAKRPDLFRAALSGAFQDASGNGSEAADAQAFLLWQMDEPGHQPSGN